MINKKICMIGDFSVGKTSLTTRFVKNIFSEKYLSTVGVKVDTKEIKVDKKTTLKLMIWDIAGKDKFTTLDDNYLRGSAGYLLVADGTRPQTIETAFKLQVHMADKFGDIPFCMLVNKCDLKSDWEYSDKELSMIKTKGWSFFETSAKSGENVDTAFFELGQKLIV
ncbi:MAG: GTP-binding protein [Gammaproteobacteria bacterium]|nr:GTP-binding protein [Gammaproteobacteria bacterium]MDH3608187.1 GTP-binding protein [Gammaproteobacteria bacterium]